MLNSPVRSHECKWRVWSTSRWTGRLVCVQHEGQSTESPLKAALRWFYPDRKEVNMIYWWRRFSDISTFTSDVLDSTTSSSTPPPIFAAFISNKFSTNFGLLHMLPSSSPVSTTCKVLYLTLIFYIITSLNYLSFAFRYKWYIFI